MTAGADALSGGSHPGDAGLGRRAWTAAGAVLPTTGVATIAGCVLAAGLTQGSTRSIATVVVLAVGVVVGLLWSRAAGADAVHGRVASARAAWAGSRTDVLAGPDGAPDVRDVALALPRGWQAEAARGRLHLAVHGSGVRAETWVLRAAAGSRRARRRREVVATDARTGSARVWVQIGATADSMLVTPAWATRRPTDEPGWLPAVRDRVARHEDLIATLSIGDDRVVLLALDDPRPGTTAARAQLVTDVAALIR